MRLDSSNILGPMAPLLRSPTTEKYSTYITQKRDENEKKFMCETGCWVFSRRCCFFSFSLFSLQHSLLLFLYCSISRALWWDCRLLHPSISQFSLSRSRLVLVLAVAVALPCACRVPLARLPAAARLFTFAFLSFCARSSCPLASPLLYPLSPSLSLSLSPSLPPFPCAFVQRNATQLQPQPQLPLSSGRPASSALSHYVQYSATRRTTTSASSCVVLRRAVHPSEEMLLRRALFPLISRALSFFLFLFVSAIRRREHRRRRRDGDGVRTQCRDKYIRVRQRCPEDPQFRV